MKLFELLLESRVDFLRDKYAPLIEKTFKLENKQSNEMFDDTYNIDPTNNKIYLQWLLERLLKLSYDEFYIILNEDAYKWKEYLEVYDNIKPRLDQNLRDINKLSLDQLKNIALQYKGKEEEILTKNHYLDKKYKINENNQYLVYMFKNNLEQDFKMYQLVSTNTEWCTRPNYKTFKEYISKSPLFIFIDKSNRNLKYQFHEESDQFMDYRDHKINSKLKIKLIQLIKNYLPEDFALRIKIDNSCGYINKDGNIIAKGFKYAYAFSEGFALVQFNDYSYGFINKDGNIIAKGFKDAWPFSEGFAKVMFIDNSWGIINKDGKIIAKGFKDAWSFKEEFAIVKFLDDSWGYINKNLKLYEDDKKTLIPKDDPRLKGIELFPENL